MRSTIICVDDDNWLLNVLADLLTEWLGANYAVEKALSGQEALDIIDSCFAEGTEVSLVISDYIMPGMKGDELLEKVKNKDPSIRRIMLTGYSALDGVINAINKAGIYRYLSKPWDNKDVMLTVLQAIRSYEQEKRAEKLSKNYEELYRKFEALAATLQINLQNTISTIAAAIDARDSGNTGHALRVSYYSVLLGRAVRMAEDNVRHLETAAHLHDAGKLGMKDEELTLLRGVQAYNHPELILRQVESAKSIIGRMHSSEVLLPGILYHMERFDGSGAAGLKVIPLEARIIGLCNYYDMLHSMRPEGDAPELTLKVMETAKGKVFDPNLFDIFAKEIVK